MSELIIVMPAYNEAECIEPVTGKWLSAFSLINVESGKLIAVNDGSKDSTGEILDSLADRDSRLIVVHQKNGGHGSALLRAYNEALKLSPEWIFHVDSDDQFEPQDLPALWQHRDKSDFITGYRKVRHDALHRLIITKIVVLLNFLLFGKFLKDANIPYRLIKAEYLRKLLRALPANIFSPNIFLAVLAAKDGQNLMEIPIKHQDRETGQVSIVRLNLIKACLRSAKELFRFRLELKQNLKKLRE